MAIGSHGTGRGGTVGDDRTGRSAELGKALSFSSLFVTPTVESDLLTCYEHTGFYEIEKILPIKRKRLFIL